MKRLNEKISGYIFLFIILSNSEGFFSFWSQNFSWGCQASFIPAASEKVFIPDLKVENSMVKLYDDSDSVLSTLGVRPRDSDLIARVLDEKTRNSANPSLIKEGRLQAAEAKISSVQTSTSISADDADRVAELEQEDRQDSLSAEHLKWIAEEKREIRKLLSKGPIIPTHTRGNIHHSEALALVAASLSPRADYPKRNIFRPMNRPKNEQVNLAPDQVLGEDEAFRLLKDTIINLEQSKTVEGLPFFHPVSEAQIPILEKLQFFLQQKALSLLNFAAKYCRNAYSGKLINEILQDDRVVGIINSHVVQASQRAIDELPGLYINIKDFLLKSHHTQYLDKVIQELGNENFEHNLFAKMTSSMFESLYQTLLKEGVSTKAYNSIFEYARVPKVFEKLMMDNPSESVRSLGRDMISKFVTPPSQMNRSVLENVYFLVYYVLDHAFSKKSSKFSENFKEEIKKTFLKVKLKLFQRNISLGSRSSEMNANWIDSIRNNEHLSAKELVGRLEDKRVKDWFEKLWIQSEDLESELENLVKIVSKLREPETASAGESKALNLEGKEMRESIMEWLSNPWISVQFGRLAFSRHVLEKNRIKQIHRLRSLRSNLNL